MLTKLDSEVRCSSITMVMLENSPTGFHYGPPLTIRGFKFSQFRAKDYTEGIQFMSYKRFQWRGSKEKMHRLLKHHYNRGGISGTSFSSVMRTPFIIIKVQL